MWTRELAECLRVTAKRIADDKTFYSWSSMPDCNCGQLVRTACDMQIVDLVAVVKKTPGYALGGWTNVARFFMGPSCPNTGYPVCVIAARLLELGLSREDMRDLEYCMNKLVLERLGYRNCCGSRDFVSAYMSAWADIIDEQLTLEEQREYKNNQCEELAYEEVS